MCTHLSFEAAKNQSRSIENSPSGGTLATVARYAPVPRFFFHLCNGSGFTGDPEGQELPDIEAARSIALAAAREVMAHEIKDGELNLASYIEVEDATGEYLFRLCFEDAFTVTRHHGESRAPDDKQSAF